MSRFDEGTAEATGADTAGELPAALPSMVRVVKHGYRAEPRLLWASLAMTTLEALPDVLVGIWLALITDGLVHHHETRMYVGAVGLAVSATLMWALSVTLDRTTRRLGDRLNIMFQGYVARLQAEVATVEHHERPVYLDRIAVLRTGVFALDHLFRSMFTMVGWLLRLAFVCILLATIHPALILLPLGALPLLVVAAWRPKVEKRTEEAVAPHGRFARHLFTVATTPPPGKEVRVTGNQADLVRRRTAAWSRWFGPIRTTNLASAAWLTLAWALFSLAFVGAVVWVVAGLDRGPGAVVLVLTAGGRLSAYVGSAVGELGFLRGIWLDSAQRLAWLEDFAAAQNSLVDESAPERLDVGIRFEDVSFAYPGTGQEVLQHVDLTLPAGKVVAVVGENGAGKSTLVKLLARMYAPTSGRITADGVDIGHVDIEEWRERLAGAFQDFARLEFVVADDGRPRRRAAPGRPHRRRCRRRPGRRHSGGRRPARRPRHPARSVVGRRRRRQLRPVAEARSGPRLHAPRAAAADARRADGSARRRDRARPVRAVRGGRPRAGHERPGHGAGVPPLLDGPDGRPDPGARRRPGHGGRQPRRAAGARRHVRRAVRHPGPELRLIAPRPTEPAAHATRRFWS